MLEGFDVATIERMSGELSRTKENLKNAIAKRTAEKTAAAA